MVIKKVIYMESPKGMGFIFKLDLKGPKNKITELLWDRLMEEVKCFRPQNRQYNQKREMAKYGRTGTEF